MPEVVMLGLPAPKVKPVLLTVVAPVLTLPVEPRSTSLFNLIVKVLVVLLATTPMLPSVKLAGVVAPPLTFSV